MSEHLTDEEQLENLKRLWKEYGTTVIASVAVATAGYFGWNYWQHSEQLKAETASEYYEQLMGAVQQASPETTTETSATVQHLLEQIKTTDQSSLYAAQGALLSAKQAVDAGDLERAEAELQWVVAETDQPAVRELAKLRLARVLAEKGEYDAALAAVSSEPQPGFVSEQAEVRGDVLRMSGDSAAALTAYEKALEKLASDDQQRRVVLEMKINHVTPASTLEEPSA